MTNETFFLFVESQKNITTELKDVMEPKRFLEFKNNKWGELIDLLFDTLVNTDAATLKSFVNVATDSLNSFEMLYPGDSRPRKTLDTIAAYLAGNINDEELNAAKYSVYCAYAAARYNSLCSNLIVSRNYMR